MMPARSHAAPRWLAGMLVACMAGCTPAGSQTTVTGQVMRGGKPLAVPVNSHGDGLDVILVALLPDGRPGTGFQADMDPQTGVFRVRGLPAKPLPPGRYRVAVTLPGGADGLPADGDFTLQASPLEIDVPATDIDLEVDLDARRVRIR